ncbi:Afi1p [Saccharomyces cerevisiae x Saccharomyces kudriavzevii VIN7]|uniref:Afi1p n=1 Tax=Saccharomyces cerevisiae x Saccharomyces kudriavzevii (strain VIN7) TaxID=1095631 RepID=H0H162_SACCK|nr:Afi1p [Saccharomyces cerevisiae x Saccharomyces kudriavzevii VIN7]
MLRREVSKSRSSPGVENESSPFEMPNVSYIISAEFHNKLGPIVKHQYPKNIPGFKQSLHGEHNDNTSVSMNLANLMIPSSIERNPGKQDITVFTLYCNKFTQNYQLFPVPKDPRFNFNLHHRDQPDSNVGNSIHFDAENNHNVQNNRYTIVLDDDDELESQEVQDNQKVSDDEPLFFINVANTILDATNDRGAVIKSIAIGTPLKTFFVFKNILVLVLDLYMKAPFQDVATDILINCFNMLNSIDLSLINNIHSKTSIQDVLHSIHDESVFTKIFFDSDSTLKKLFRIHGFETKDKYGNTVTFHDQFIQYHFTKFKSKTLPSYFSKIPLQFDMIKRAPIYIENDYNELVLKFLNRFIPYLPKAGSKAKVWKLAINSTKLSKEDLCAFILSLANITANYAGDLPSYFKGNTTLIFPYMDISLVDSLRAYLTSSDNSIGCSAIIGTANPVFQYQLDIWDYYYNMDEDILYENNGTEKLDTRVEIKNGSNALKKIFNRPHFSSYVVAENQFKLGRKLFSLLVDEYHDSDTMMGVLRRLNVLQLENLIGILKRREISSDIALKDEYIMFYKDFFIFPEFFDYFTLHSIELLSNLDNCLFSLGNAGLLFSTEQTYSRLSQILDIVKELFRMISISKTNVEKFLNACLNYSPSIILPSAESETNNFSKWSFEKEVHRGFNNYNRYMGIERDTHGVSLSSIDLFTKVYSFDILALFLTFTAKDCRQRLPSTKSLTRKRTYLSRIAQSYSFRQFLQMSAHHSVRISGSDGQGFRNSGQSEFTNASSIITPKLKASPLLERRAFKISQAIVNLLYKLECHPIGRVLLGKYLHDQFREAYEELKIHVFDRKKDSGGTNPSNASSIIPSPCLATASVSLSLKRTEMSNNLKKIREQPESVDDTMGSPRKND